MIRSRRALGFVSLVLANAALILVNLSFGSSLRAMLRDRNGMLWLVLVVAVALLGLVLTWAPAQQLFRFGPVHADDLALCAGAAIGVLFLLDLVKPLWRACLQR